MDYLIKRRKGVIQETRIYQGDYYVARIQSSNGKFWVDHSTQMEDWRKFDTEDDAVAAAIDKWEKLVSAQSSFFSLLVGVS